MRETTSRLSIADLRSEIRGRVIDPSDPDYDQARVTFYGGFDRRPAAIIRPAGVQDIVTVVNLARQTGTELAIRSGGHSVAGHSLSEGGLVLDLREMRALEINVPRKTAWVEPGLTAGEYTKAVDEYGLATGFGDTGSVGIGGITLGGGVGYLARKYGLTIDNLMAAEIVTADGEIRQASESENPDLFWAIRGGGGNFGVVTRFQFRLHDVSNLTGGMLILPATPETIAGFMAAAEAAPEALSGIANVMPAPPMPFLPPEAHGKLIIMALLACLGDPETAQRVLAPIRALATPLADMLRPIRYPEMFPPDDPSYHPTAVSHNMFMDHIGVAEAETILRYLQATDAPVRVAQLRVLGGAVARVPAEATAYAHRQARIMVNLAAFYTSPADQAVKARWLADFAAALNQGVAGGYVNFIADEGPEWVRAAYPGATYQRLAAIKAKYDPTNLFRVNQNVQPKQ